MLPWTFSEEGAAEKHMAQLQHNMWVANARSAVLSIITGGGKWVEMTIHADPLYRKRCSAPTFQMMTGSESLRSGFDRWGLEWTLNIVLSRSRCGGWKCLPAPGGG